MSGTVMLEVCPLNPLDCWVGVGGVCFSSTSDKCSIALGSGQTTAEATLWAFCHVLSQSIRMGDVYVACTDMPLRALHAHYYPHHLLAL